MRRIRSGWFLPPFDTYFDGVVGPTYRPGAPPKSNGFMREHLLEAFRHVRKWDVAVDVGAHCGFWAFDMAQRFDKVYCFEPTPANFACLVKNLEECPNVELRNAAVGAAAGHCTVHNDSQRPGNSGSFFVQPAADGPIEMIRLDDLDLPGCDLLKVDVEGYELKVLTGARKLIKRFRPVIIMETTDTKFKGRYPDILRDEAQRWLARCGYREVWAGRPDKVFVSG
jgi:FkbM family methyltransferase